MVMGVKKIPNLTACSLWLGQIALTLSVEAFDPVRQFVPKAEIFACSSPFISLAPKPLKPPSEIGGGGGRAEASLLKLFYHSFHLCRERSDQTKCPRYDLLTVVLRSSPRGLVS